MSGRMAYTGCWRGTVSAGEDLKEKIRVEKGIKKLAIYGFTITSNVEFAITLSSKSSCCTHQYSDELHILNFPAIETGISAHIEKMVFSNNANITINYFYSDI